MQAREPKGDVAGYSGLVRRLAMITLVFSMVPLLLVGWGIYIHYSRFAESRMTDSFREHVEHHLRTIELFLGERTACLQVVAQTRTLEDLSDEEHLGQVFRTMNRQYEDSFTDLGVIDESGDHLAYVGPYDLIDRNYTRAPWFSEVMDQGIHVSDMFTGFRKVPHFVVAVLRAEEGRRWILRATIDTEAFRSLVEDVRLGRTGEVTILNSEGLFQTRPRFHGEIMSRSPFPVQPFHEGIRVRTMTPEHSPRQLVAHSWLETKDWMVVVRQDYAEAFSDVNHANRTTLVFLHLGALAIFLVSLLTTRHMVRIIRRRDEEASRLNSQLVQASKLAAIGELSAGVAHEINNPMAIISSAREILAHRTERATGLDAQSRSLLDRHLAQIGTQVKRCKHITHSLLRFARRTTSRMEEVDLNAFVTEVMDLMRGEAGSSGIELVTDLDDELPRIESDPSQLQQVFLNLITNAMEAHEGMPYGTITASTRTVDGGRRVEVSVLDTGSGIRPEHMDRIFDPFYTTKPVGKGTGLGLSICHSIVESLGGNVAVRSEPGEGTEFTVSLPVAPPAGLRRSMGDSNEEDREPLTRTEE